MFIPGSALRATWWVAWPQGVLRIGPDETKCMRLSFQFSRSNTAEHVLLKLDGGRLCGSVSCGQWLTADNAVNLVLLT